jgi:hypothetical protein
MPVKVLCAKRSVSSATSKKPKRQTSRMTTEAPNSTEQWPPRRGKVVHTPQTPDVAEEPVELYDEDEPCVEASAGEDVIDESGSFPNCSTRAGKRPMPAPEDVIVELSDDEEDNDFWKLVKKLQEVRRKVGFLRTIQMSFCR